jgi:hypothetical protein
MDDTTLGEVVMKGHYLFLLPMPHDQVSLRDSLDNV